MNAITLTIFMLNCVSNI